MKPLVHISRFLVGALFIFSGLVKAIDPLGLTYKMQEFFEVWIQDGYFVKAVSFLNNHAFLFSVAMITAEVVLGVALLIGWRKKLVLWLLLLLMLLFTFLTAFVLFSGKIRACGCFGDCIPLTPVQTFTKDIILLALLLLLLAKQKYIEPLLGYRLPFAIVMIALIGTLFLQHYVIEHLPIVDCLPYKKGNNILELRKMPANAIPDKYSYSFVYEKGGEKKDFTTDALPDSTWKFVERKQTLVQKGSNNVPLINDFILSDSTGADSTETILSKPLYYLFLIKEVTDDTDKWLSVFTDIAKSAAKGNVPLYIVTADPKGANKFFNSIHDFKLPVYTCDAIALKTAARANPTLLVMTGSVIKEKYSWADMDVLVK
jgi:uncharacterized membrane protein YphA (DoxX/SURF4 family)